MISLSLTAINGIKRAKEVYAKEKDRIIVTYSDLGEQLKDIVVLTKDEYATKVSKNNIIIYFNDPRKNIL